jgi:polyhydroxyalkanoate synthesis regulator phasin
MAGFGNLVQKAVYLGIGLASYAGEKAGEKLTELRAQVQKLADEMVERGEMNAEEARRFVDEMVSRAQQTSTQPPTDTTPKEPRRIEILSDDEDETPKSTSTSDSGVDQMRRQVEELQEELRRLKRE